MIKRDEILMAIQPFVLRWIEERTNTRVSGASGGSSTGSAGLVAISSADLTPDFLNAKLVPGTGLDTAIQNAGGNETLLVSVAPSEIDHGNLAGLSDDAHLNYLTSGRHSAIDHTSLVHAAMTVADSSTIDFTLTGQQITASVIQSAIDHGNLAGRSDDDHTQYLLASGARAVAGNLIPDASDARDLGSISLLWRKGFFSEFDAFVFAENTISAVGGWLWVSKNQGKFGAAVSSGATTVDFGKAVTVGDFIVCRSLGQVEYMLVGSLVSGTTYNVTRNLDGSGANTWPDGAVWVSLGQNGDGRIELNAYDTPRISIKTQGATWNSATEPARIGDLNGSYGVSSQSYGIGIGDYSGGNYLLYNPAAADPFVIKSVDGSLNIDSEGIVLTASYSGTIDSSAYALADNMGVYGGLYGEASDISSFRVTSLRCKSPVIGIYSLTGLYAYNYNETKRAGIDVKADDTEGQVTIFSGSPVGGPKIVVDPNGVEITADDTSVSGNVEISGYLDIAEQTTPSTPPSGYARIFSTSNAFYLLNDSGQFFPFGIMQVDLPINAFYLSGAVISAPYSGHAAMAFRDAQDDYADIKVYVPRGWDGRALTLDLVWASPVSSGNVLWGPEIRYENPGSALSSTANLSNYNTYASGSTVIRSSISMGTLNVADDYSAIDVRIWRSGNNANDTLAGTAYILSARLRVW